MPTAMTVMATVSTLDMLPHKPSSKPAKVRCNLSMEATLEPLYNRASCSAEQEHYVAFVTVRVERSHADQVIVESRLCSLTQG
jgi:hypothetical protein